MFCVHHQVTKTGSTTDATPQIVNAVVLSDNAVICQAPAAARRRRRRAANDAEIIANGYIISISNDDGITWSDPVAFYAYDTKCYVCDQSNGTCTDLVGTFN